MIEQFILLNTSTGESLDFNMTTGPIWLDSLDVSAVEGIDQLYGTPGQDGELHASTYLGTRSVVITAWIVNRGKTLAEQKAQLNRFCNPKQPLDILVGEYKLTFIPGYSIQYSKEKKENNEVMCKFVIMGQAYNPFWTSQQEVESLVSYIEPLWVLPFYIPQDGMVFGVNQPTASTQIDNENLPVGCKIMFSASGGSVVNPGIICAETQEQTIIAKTLSSGEQITVDTRVGHRRITGLVGTESYNGMKYLDPSSDWITLATGLNTFSFFAESGSEFLAVSIKYSPLLLEVEG